RLVWAGYVIRAASLSAGCAAAGMYGVAGGWVASEAATFAMAAIAIARLRGRERASGDGGRGAGAAGPGRPEKIEAADGSEAQAGTGRMGDGGCGGGWGATPPGNEATGG
ncbi:MAG: hypothetical protein N3A38_03550, partial [Planctomycetota bacterium]|nr:hypothetical protein [Planctomycetota bacterium]